MGALAFIYRMMGLREYTVRQVDDMFVWQVAIVLDVDLKMVPMTDDGPALPAGLASGVVVDQATMETYSEEFEMSEDDLAALLGRGAVGVGDHPNL